VLEFELPSLGQSMRRREFISLVSGAAVTWPLVARAQPLTKVARIGFLGVGPASSWTDQVEALRAGLRDLGDIEGKNILIDFRWADGVGQLPDLASELVRRNVDIIVAPASTEVEPARQATKTIPIVFTQHADPVGLGHVASLARPGGNITGVSMVLPEIAAKALEVFKDAVPNATRVGVLRNPTTPSHEQVMKAVEIAAKSLGIQLLDAPVVTTADFDGIFSMMTREHADGFLVPSSPLTNSARVPLAELQLTSRLPGVFVNKENVEAGGFLSYGADFNYMYRHAALYVDKILKGKKPEDLPVEQASKYQLVINLKTAKALGLEVPARLLTRADEVIE
jgi:putative tryptophan/tyrosine transport system substrate-binding protein